MALELEGGRLALLKLSTRVSSDKHIRYDDSRHRRAPTLVRIEGV